MTCNPTRDPFTPTETAAVGVSIEGLSKSFGRFEVLKNVTFSVAPGEIFVLMGPSGSGKSVLLKHIVGLEQPSAGRVTVAGRDASSEATRAQVRMALVFQSGALFNSLSVYDNLALYPREHQIADEAAIREKVMRALQILSLEGSAHKAPSELSGGMKQRVALARALAPNPRILCMDEPFAALDAMTREQLYADLQDIWAKRKKTLLFVTHNVREAVCLGDRVVLFSPNPGRIREQFHIQLPRPRDINSVELAEQATLITRALKQHNSQSLTAE
jgi:ABC-type nitrate/sulfonate/bicarbonate transport system ATPase subunit